MAPELVLEDPAQKQRLTIKMVPRADLAVISHQRKPRPAHLKALTASIERIGFVTPIVAVERDGHYVVIDGQHRLRAGSDLGLEEFPVVVVPERLARRMMSLNIEQALNIRERATIALSIYRDMRAEDPGRLEDDGEVSDALETAHLVTLGLAYERSGRLAGGAFEDILKKCDGFLDQSLETAYEARQLRADKVVAAAEAVKAVEEALKARGSWHSMARYQIISYANPTKRARKPSDFDKTFDRMIATLTELEGSPEKVLGQRLADE